MSCGAGLTGYAAGTVTGLTDGILYSVSLWIKTVGEDAKARILLLDGEDVTDACPYTSTDGKWQYLQNVCVSVSGEATVIFETVSGTSSSADFYIDNIQFERAVPATSFNFVENSNFSETGNPHWTIPTSAAVVSYPENYTGVPAKLLGSKLDITGSSTDAISVTQSISLNGKAGQTYTFGGWASAVDALPSGDSNSGRALSISVVKPAVGQEPESELARIEYNTYVANWQFQESSFTLDDDCSSVEIRLNYNNQSGTASFDGIEFFKDGLFMNLNTSGDIVNTSEEPDSAAQTSLANRSGVTSASEADSFGNVTKSYSTNGQVKIQQSSTYTEDGNYSTSSTNELGATTTYTYNTTAQPNNEQLGLISNITDAQNNVINYAYNSMMQNTSVSQTVANPYGAVTSLNLSTAYSYNDSDKPSEITAANGTHYYFTYTLWGDISTVSVGTTLLAFYQYDIDSERKLHKINYANARNFFIYKWQDERGIDIDLYGYCIGSDDDQHLVLGMYKNDFGVPFMCVDGNDHLYVERDGVMVEFAYDEVGANIIHSYGQKSIGNGTEFLEKIGSSSITSTFKNDDEGNPALATFSINGSTSEPVNQEKRYDEFNRLIAAGTYAGTSSEAPENAALWKTYTYTDKPGFRTTNQIDGVNIFGGTGTDSFSQEYRYSYDLLGNITNIYKNGALLVHYEYDGAGQLIRENNAQQNKTITYEYNSDGNLIYKREFAFTTGSLEQLTPDTIPFVYGDTNWPDKLTSVNGSEDFEYDASGNPTEAMGTQLEWENRGQLKTVTDSEQTINYTYDYNGIRTSKTVTPSGSGSITTNYTTVDGRITCQQTGNNKIIFFYDESGQLVGLNYEGTDYFYVKNLQGDIIGITDVDGKLLVEYTYDTWGELLSTVNSAQNNIAADNPFLYRGYYLDRETDLYYLQSRYYSPGLCRFINADGIEYVDGSSLFMYCGNNPTSRRDPTGKAYIIYEINGKPVTLKKYLGSMDIFGRKIYNTNTLLVWPVPYTTNITSGFGMRDNPLKPGYKQFHYGIDIACGPVLAGKSIVAAGDGKIIKAAYSNTMGNYIVIAHNNGIYTSYLHCSKLAVTTLGAAVRAGQTIAYIGNTGSGTGNHLHFAIFSAYSTGDNNKYAVNPMNYLYILVK